MKRPLVWDWPTRLFHWLLTLCFAGSWVTAEAGFDWTEVHFLLGYTTLGLVVFRVVWGLVGPTHARFSGFLKSPRIVLQYTRTLFSRTNTRSNARTNKSASISATDKPSESSSSGHNPLGGWMVMVLLGLVAVQASTGLFLSDDIFYAGPYNPVVSGKTADTLAGIHHLNFNVLQGAVLLHVIAIFFYAAWRKQNLVGPMLSGRKDVPQSAAIASSQSGRACLIAVLVAGAIWALVAFAPPPVIMDF